MNVKKFRDLTRMEISEELELILACDSLGGIGPREMDIVKCSAEVSGYFTAVVVLAEIMAYRAEPIILVNNLCYEMENYGEETLAGIERALKESGFEKCHITGSTEENIPVCQTGIGITVIGKAKKKIREIMILNSGDACFLIGTPYMGEEVLNNLDNIKTLEYLKILTKDTKVKDILPVGSKGIVHELREIQKTNGLNLILSKNIVANLQISAGPATCFLITGNLQYLGELLSKNQIQNELIGVFE
ncbi:selenophosphate synthase [Alkalibacter mobilis]|uniref:selenophosphate synthase n=1 Tax=Alkalibacter mobilis TaxID=2787712 RepID=UPI00189E2851|nr:selenophosphate synthase [Alkalibacter mobilis]MBF7096871.1 selenophosphate synthase [Alkalibacter mobilis]